MSRRVSTLARLLSLLLALPLLLVAALALVLLARLGTAFACLALALTTLILLRHAGAALVGLLTHDGLLQCGSGIAERMMQIGYLRVAWSAPTAVDAIRRWMSFESGGDCIA